jgi:hypothetical protein
VPTGIKGSAVKALLDWLRDSHPARVAAILQRLPASTRAVLEGRLLPSFQFPYPLYVELLEAMAAEFGPGYTAQALAHGRWAADMLLETIYRLTVKTGNVPRTLELLADSWKVIFDTGEISIDQPTPGRCTMSIVDPTYSPLHAWISAGYTQRACERAGGKNVRAEVSGQPPRVDLTITWS